MKKIYYFGLAGSLWLAFTTFDAISKMTGPPEGHTGAPGEKNCTQCHSGLAVNAGQGQPSLDYNDGVDTTYQPGASGGYQLPSTLTEDGSENCGIQITALDKNNNKAGNFVVTMTTRTQVINGSNNRQYFQHSATKTQNPGGMQWNCIWEPPSTNVGNITFYAAFVGGNNNISSSGDVVYTRKKTITIDPTWTGIQSSVEKKKMHFGAFPTICNDFVNLTFQQEKAEQVQISMISMDGKNVHQLFQGNVQSGLFERQVNLPSVKAGTYLVRLQSGDNQAVQRIIVQ